MKIFLANDSKQSLGGGFSFIKNFRAGLPKGVEIAQTIRTSDIVLLPSSTMVRPETVNEIEALRKPMILRIDNLPKNSRNRNTGTSRLLRYHELARGVIYQSEWAQGYLRPWLDLHEKKKQRVILNGVDVSVFTHDGPRIEKRGMKIFLYSRFNRDETKGWNEAWYKFQFEYRRNKNVGLWIVGNFSAEQSQYNFDFFQGEMIRYWGVMEEPHEYAQVLRSANCFYAPYYNDACSNALIEALACGLEIDCCTSGFTGGAPEIFRAFERQYDFSRENMAIQYVKFIEGLL